MTRRYTVWVREHPSHPRVRWECGGLHAWLWTHARRHERRLVRRGLDVELRDATGADLAPDQGGYSGKLQDGD